MKNPFNNKTDWDILVWDLEKFHKTSGSKQEEMARAIWRAFDELIRLGNKPKLAKSCKDKFKTLCEKKGILL